MLYNYNGGYMNIEFGSLKELYDRITPSLISKRTEIESKGYYHIKESDIWNYLTSKKWKISKELTLAEMVSDIFNANIEDINAYVIKKISTEMREPIFDE